jgi:heterodisulfide reductase subunit B
LEHVVYRRGNSIRYLLVGVYVNDLIITGTDLQDIASFKQQMQELFRMSDLGQLSYYLGIKVTQGEDEITLCQRRYAEKVMEVAGLKNCNSCRTPMDCRLKLKKEDGNGEVDKTLYRSVIGSLRYLMNSRPDIAMDVGVASRFMENPTATHWALAKQILRYVRGTLSFGCRYIKGEGEPVLLGYSDSDHAGDLEDRKSMSGITFFLGNNLVTWSSQKQKCVAHVRDMSHYVT